MIVKAVIDRFEGDYVIILLGEEEQAINFPLKFLPCAVKEGDCLKIKIEMDQEETMARSKRIKALMQELFEEEKS